MSLAVRLALVIFLGALLPLAAAGALILGQIEASLLDDARADRVQTARVAARLVDDYVAGGEARLQWIAGALATELPDHPGDREWLQGRLNELAEPSDVFLDLTFRPSTEQAPGENWILNSGRNDPRPPVQQMTGSNFSNGVPQEQPPPGVRSGPMGVDPDSTPYLTLSSDVAACGTLEGRLDLSPLPAILAQAGGDMALSLLDLQGASLAEHGRVAEPADSIAAAVPGRGWTVRARQSRSAVLGEIRLARSHAMLWLAGAAAAALALSGLLSAWLTRPIRSLTRTVGEIERGRLDVRTAVNRSDELGRLAGAVDRMAASLQQLDRMKSDFVATASHELRTPLTSALMSLDNLRLLGPVSEKQDRAVSRIRSDLDRLIRLVNELLDLQAIQAGGAKPAPVPSDAAALSREVSDTFRDAARGVTLAVDAPESLPAVFDSTRMRQVLINLVDNAIKFTPPGGRVTISATRAVDAVVWTVEDTGPGVPEDLRPRLFQRFAKGTTAPGAGLGLAIVRELVELQGGTVRLEGASRFIVTLPCRAS